MVILLAKSVPEPVPVSMTRNMLLRELLEHLVVEIP
jgi:hypothetical protein